MSKVWKGGGRGVAWEGVEIGGGGICDALCIVREAQSYFSYISYLSVCFHMHARMHAGASKKVTLHR